LRLEADLKKLSETQDVTKQIEEKREATSFRIKDINMRNREIERKIGDLAGLREIEMQKREKESGEQRTLDPFARIVNKPTVYWTVKPDKKEEALKALPEPAADSAPDASTSLTVDVSKAGPSGSELVSPGFKDLLATPRDDGDANWALPDDVLAGFGDVPPSEQKLGWKGAGGKLPTLAGKRAEAHNAQVDIDIDINPVVKQTQRHRPVAGASQSGTPLQGAARPRSTLSVTDYLNRARQG